jgi:CRP/FNR family transcriptional regulator
VATAKASAHTRPKEGAAPTHHAKRASQSEIAAAVAMSALARMPVTARDAIVAASTVVSLRSRTSAVRFGETERIVLVVRGLMRVYRTTVDGRELTVAWARPGVIAGFAAMVLPPSHFSAQPVTDAVVLYLPPSLVRDRAKAEAAVAWVIAEEVAFWLQKAVAEMVLYAYGDLRSRVSQRLLELACKAPADGPLIAQLTQDDLALAVGATRPAVARVLKELRDAGSVRSMYGGVLIQRPEVLAEQI